MHEAKIHSTRWVLMIPTRNNAKSCRLIKRVGISAKLDVIYRVFCEELPTRYFSLKDEIY